MEGTSKGSRRRRSFSPKTIFRKFGLSSKGSAGADGTRHPEDEDEHQSLTSSDGEQLSPDGGEERGARRSKSKSKAKHIESKKKKKKNRKKWGWGRGHKDNGSLLDHQHPSAVSTISEETEDSASSFSQEQAPSSTTGQPTPSPSPRRKRHSMAHVVQNAHGALCDASTVPTPSSEGESLGRGPFPGSNHTNATPLDHSVDLPAPLPSLAHSDRENKAPQEHDSNHSSIPKTTTSTSLDQSYHGIRLSRGSEVRMGRRTLSIEHPHDALLLSNEIHSYVVTPTSKSRLIPGHRMSTSSTLSFEMDMAIASASQHGNNNINGNNGSNGNHRSSGTRTSAWDASRGVLLETLHEMDPSASTSHTGRALDSTTGYHSGESARRSSHGGWHHGSSKRAHNHLHPSENSIRRSKHKGAHGDGGRYTLDTFKEDDEDDEDEDFDLESTADQSSLYTDWDRESRFSSSVIGSKRNSNTSQLSHDGALKRRRSLSRQPTVVVTEESPTTAEATYTWTPPEEPAAEDNAQPSAPADPSGTPSMMPSERTEGSVAKAPLATQASEDDSQVSSSPPSRSSNRSSSFSRERRGSRSRRFSRSSRRGSLRHEKADIFDHYAETIALSPARSTVSLHTLATSSVPPTLPPSPSQQEAEASENEKKDAGNGDDGERDAREKAATDGREKNTREHDGTARTPSPLARSHGSTNQRGAQNTQSPLSRCSISNSLAVGGTAQKDGNHGNHAASSAVKERRRSRSCNYASSKAYLASLSGNTSPNDDNFSKNNAAKTHSWLRSSSAPYDRKQGDHTHGLATSPSDSTRSRRRSSSFRHQREQMVDATATLTSTAVPLNAALAQPHLRAVFLLGSTSSVASAPEARETASSSKASPPQAAWNAERIAQKALGKKRKMTRAQRERSTDFRMKLGKTIRLAGEKKDVVDLNGIKDILAMLGISNTEIVERVATSIVSEYGSENGAVKVMEVASAILFSESELLEISSDKGSETGSVCSSRDGSLSTIASSSPQPSVEKSAPSIQPNADKRGSLRRPNHDSPLKRAEQRVAELETALAAANARVENYKSLSQTQQEQIASYQKGKEGLSRVKAVYSRSMKSLKSLVVRAQARNVDAIFDLSSLAPIKHRRVSAQDTLIQKLQMQLIDLGEQLESRQMEGKQQDDEEDSEIVRETIERLHCDLQKMEAEKEMQSSVIDDLRAQNEKLAGIVSEKIDTEIEGYASIKAKCTAMMDLCCEDFSDLAEHCLQVFDLLDKDGSEGGSIAALGSNLEKLLSERLALYKENINMVTVDEPQQSQKKKAQARRQASTQTEPPKKEETEGHLSLLASGRNAARSTPGVRSETEAAQAAESSEGEKLQASAGRDENRNGSDDDSDCAARDSLPFKTRASKDIAFGWNLLSSDSDEENQPNSSSSGRFRGTYSFHSSQSRASLQRSSATSKVLSRSSSLSNSAAPEPISNRNQQARGSEARSGNNSMAVTQQPQPQPQGLLAQLLGRNVDASLEGLAETRAASDSTHAEVTGTAHSRADSDPDALQFIDDDNYNTELFQITSPIFCDETNENTPENVDEPPHFPFVFAPVTVPAMLSKETLAMQARSPRPATLSSNRSSTAHRGFISSEEYTRLWALEQIPKEEKEDATSAHRSGRNNASLEEAGEDSLMCSMVSTECVQGTPVEKNAPTRLTQHNDSKQSECERGAASKFAQDGGNDDAEAGVDDDDDDSEYSVPPSPPEQQRVRMFGTARSASASSRASLTLATADATLKSSPSGPVSSQRDSQSQSQLQLQLPSGAPVSLVKREHCNRLHAASNASLTSEQAAAVLAEYKACNSMDALDDHLARRESLDTIHEGESDAEFFEELIRRCSSSDSGKEGRAPLLQRQERVTDSGSCHEHDEGGRESGPDSSGNTSRAPGHLIAMSSGASHTRMHVQRDPSIDSLGSSEAASSTSDAYVDFRCLTGGSGGYDNLCDVEDENEWEVGKVGVDEDATRAPQQPLTGDVPIGGPLDASEKPVNMPSSSLAVNATATAAGKSNQVFSQTPQATMGSFAVLNPAKVILGSTRAGSASLERQDSLASSVASVEDVMAARERVSRYASMRRQKKHNAEEQAMRGKAIRRMLPQQQQKQLQQRELKQPRALSPRLADV